MNRLSRYPFKYLGLALIVVAGMASASGYGVSSEPATAQARSITNLVSSNRADFQAQLGITNHQAHQSPAAASRPKANSGEEQNSGIGSNENSKEAFAAMVRNMMPLSPEQIRVLRYMFDQSQRAANTAPGTPPRPTSSTVMVDLSPGATPPVIRLKAGYVTSLVFLDATGEPWPITAYDIGDPQAFNIAPNQPDGKSDTLLVQASKNYKSGNLAVMLKDKNTPIMITLMPGQRAIDYRVDLRVPGLGPNAKPEMSGLPSTENAQLIHFLNGVPPHGAKRLTVSGGQCDGWEYGGQIYLRTRLTVLSPSWKSTMKSPDGMHVYELVKTPVVLASYHGKTTQLMIEGL